ncbi:MAG: Jag N-terminal domain-containing protein [Deltaproteobacteria bacterium]|jgi:spoIIIJ-associated protein|nr:Jag N-terminal domain-containing protein [Deltaproteobacteria bacterium]
MSPDLIFEGKNTEEAINAASKALDIPPEHLSFIILSTGSKGLFGLGGRKAKIQVLSTEPQSQDPPAETSPLESAHLSPEVVAHAKEASLEPENAKKFLRLEKPQKTDKLERQDKPNKVDQLHQGTFNKAEEIKEDKARSELLAGPAESSLRKTPSKEEAKAKKLEKRPRRERVGPKVTLKEPKETKAKKVEPPTENPAVEDIPHLKWSSFPVPGPLTKPGKGEEVYDGPPDQVTQDAVSLLKEIIQRLGLTVEIRASRIGQRVILDLESLDNYLLIGRKGASLNALELLVNRVTRQRSRLAERNGPLPVSEDSDLDSRAKVKALLEATESDNLDAICQDKPEDAIDDNPQIIVDAENYRARRHQGILEKTAYMAEKVLKTNKPMVITQLSSPERRLVHLAIDSVPGLTTRSHGFGLVRNLTILPNKAKNKATFSRANQKNL